MNARYKLPADEYTSITSGRIDISSGRLLVLPWIYKIALGKWANARERFYLQMYVSLN